MPLLSKRYRNETGGKMHFNKTSYHFSPPRLSYFLITSPGREDKYGK